MFQVSVTGDANQHPRCSCRADWEGGGSMNPPQSKMFAKEDPFPQLPLRRFHHRRHWA
jgi:hypothetical protein